MSASAEDALSVLASLSKTVDVERITSGVSGFGYHPASASNDACRKGWSSVQNADPIRIHAAAAVSISVSCRRASVTDVSRLSAVANSRRAAIRFPLQ